MNENSQAKIFFRVFIFSSLGCGLLWALLMTIAVGEANISYFPISFYVGIALGLIIGIVVSHSNKPISIKLIFDEKEEFMRKIELSFRKYNMFPLNQSEKFIDYRYQGFSLIPVVIYMEKFQNYAIVYGPKHFLDKLSNEIIAI